MDQIEEAIEACVERAWAFYENKLKDPLLTDDMWHQQVEILKEYNVINDDKHKEID
jgi:hypothetical protein